MHLQMLKVRYDEVACRIFPCTLYGKAVVWYHILPLNSIQNWKGFKKLFPEKIVDDKTPSMLLKELGNMKMAEREG